jgi:beta-lactamase class D
MKLISITSILLLSLVLFSCSKKSHFSEANTRLTLKNTVIRSDFKRYFDSCNVEGSVVIYDYSRKQYIVSDTTQIYQEVLPASTFKIPNLLIALETNTIRSENDTVKWIGSTDTVKYGYRPEIYHDMTVKEAFQVSAGWLFVELAKKIGKENYQKFLTKTGYGNSDLSQIDPDFWNFGSFGVSPVNQVLFLQNLYENKLPFSRRNMEIVKTVMINEQRKGYTLRAKTGWTRDKGLNTGWWVGWEEKNGKVYFFATRLLQDRKNNGQNFANCRKEITRKILSELDK